jgi:hypothetical protein
VLLGWWGLALGAPLEEITVYGDRYARWDDTRWLVRSEGVFPGGGLPVETWQLELELHCQKGEAQLWDGLEVLCAVERVALQPPLEEVQALLEQSSVQLQVSPEGTVPNLDLEGVTAHNLPQRQIQEQLRQLLSLAMAGFSLRLPDPLRGSWLEYHSALMDLPSPTASRGSSRFAHQITESSGDYLVTSEGRGTTALSMTGTLGGEQLWSMKAHSQAVIRSADGVMSTREWSLQGTSRGSEPCRIQGSLRLHEQPVTPGR